MTRLLIIEDDDDKAKALSSFVEEAFYISHLSVARSMQTGLLAALAEDHDLILLDMTMTNYERSIQEDGGRPHHFAGREILRQMLREDVLTPVVVVTQFGRFGEESEEVTLSDLQTELKARFPQYLGTVHYRSNVDDWTKQLSNLTREILIGK
jgi:CheY-like chemotaxis protein